MFTDFVENFVEIERVEPIHPRHSARLSELHYLGAFRRLITRHELRANATLY